MCVCGWAHWGVFWVMFSVCPEQAAGLLFSLLGQCADKRTESICTHSLCLSVSLSLESVSLYSIYKQATSHYLVTLHDYLIEWWFLQFCAKILIFACHSVEIINKALFKIKLREIVLEMEGQVECNALVDTSLHTVCNLYACMHVFFVCYYSVYEYLKYFKKFSFNLPCFIFQS